MVVTLVSSGTPALPAPRRGHFRLNLSLVCADIVLLGEFHGPVSIRSAASEHIPPGGAVRFRDVPDSPISGSFGMDAVAGALTSPPVTSPAGFPVNSATSD